MQIVTVPRNTPAKVISALLAQGVALQFEARR